MNKAQRTFVLGAGISGMTTAVALAEAGLEVQVLAREFSPHTTSDLAGAIWYPSHAWPLEKTRVWGLETLNELLRLHEVEGPDSTGIRLVTGTRHFFRQMGYPWWRNHVPHFRILSEQERPEQTRTSYEYTVPLVDMRQYLGYLRARLIRAGGELVQREFQNWQQVQSLGGMVVNCVGLGAFHLLGDKDLYPVRGQVLESQNLKVSRFVLSADHPEGSIYVIPRAQGVVVGGGSQSGVWDLTPDPVRSEKLLMVARGLSSQIPVRDAGWEVRVGLRPGRKTVRCEYDPELSSSKQHVVHNYGHTGAGVTLSWGCAWQVRSAVLGLLQIVHGKFATPL